MTIVPGTIQNYSAGLIVANTIRKVIRSTDRGKEEVSQSFADNRIARGSADMRSNERLPEGLVASLQ